MKTHQMFTGHFGFVFEKNSVREIKLLSMIIVKLSFSKSSVF